MSIGNIHTHKTLAIVAVNTKKPTPRVIRETSVAMVMVVEVEVEVEVVVVVV